jgi:4-diphosphocytidyl-2-C-methyl-D-erythritol kinase
MVTLDLRDTLTFEQGDGLSLIDAIDWTPNGPGMQGGFVVPSDGSNLVSRALVTVGTTAQITLTKHIPAGAGLGGGSADAAAVLRHYGFADLERASSLGSDIPFCLAGGRARVSGIGSVIEPLPYEEHSFVVVTPAFGVSTVLVYKTYDELGARADPHGHNDLTEAAFTVEPRLVAWRDLLHETTGREVVLAGSGSSLFVECTSGERDALAALVQGRVKEIKERALVTPTTTVKSS